MSDELRTCGAANAEHQFVGHRALWPGLGVEIESLPTDAPLPASTRDALVRLLRDQLVVLVRSVPEPPVHQLRVTQALGRVVGTRARGRGIRGARPELRHESEAGANPFTRIWHSDTSWAVRPARYTLLHATSIRGVVAPTELLDTSRAYAELPAQRRDEIGAWSTWHHVALARGRAGPGSRSERIRARLRSMLDQGARRRGHFDGERFDTVVLPHPPPPGAAHDVVQFDEWTGRRHIYLGEHAWKLDHLDEGAGRMALGELRSEMEHEPFRHHWHEGDLLIFDNRVLLHRRGDPRCDAAAASVRELRRTLAWSNASS